MNSTEVHLPQTLADPSDLAWADQGACRGTTVNFFTTKKAALAEQVALCNVCPVNKECLEYALNNEEFGTWGGLTEAERKDLMK